MTALTMRTVREAGGIVRHVPTPFVPAPAAKGRKTKVVPDPIRTNGESVAEKLRLFIERIERIDEEIAGMQDDRKDVFAELKSQGFSDKAIRTILAIRKKSRDDFAEEETILELYRQHLGML